MFKRILVPVDPARPFGAANDYACSLAQTFGSHIVANYIVDEALMAGAGEAVTALDDAMEWVGKAAMDDFVKGHSDLSVEKRLSYGKTSTAIFQSVLHTGADLVVIGGYKRLANPSVWGSTVTDIVHHDERSTFVVRRRYDLPGPGDRIIVPYDGSRQPQDTLRPVCRFAAERGAIVDLVYAARKSEAEAALHWLDKGRIIVEGHGAQCETHCLQRGRFAPKGKAILAHARTTKSPLIALSRLGKTSSQTGRSRTLAWLLTHSELPVWVMRK